MKNKQDNREIKEPSIYKTLERIGNAIIWFCIGGIVTALCLSL